MARTIDHAETRKRLAQVLGEDSEAFERAESRWTHTNDEGRDAMVRLVASVSNDDLRAEFGGSDDARDDERDDEPEQGSVDE